MKQSFFSFAKFTVCLAMLFASLFLNSCAEAQQKPLSSSKKGAKPSIDIHAAIAAGNSEAVRQHIAAGTNINQKEALGGSSPLITACLYSQKEIAGLLIKSGADINFQNNDGSTALHVAAFFCKPEIVKLLLQNRADKTIKNKYGNTAYETVAAPFSTLKGIYEQMKQMLRPMGVELDLAYIEKTRPAIAMMLK